MVAEGVGDFRSRGGMKRGCERAAVVTQRWTMGVRVRARRFLLARTTPVARGTAAVVARVNARVAVVVVVTMVIVVAVVVAVVVVTESHVEDVAAVEIVVRQILTVQIRTMTRRRTRRRIEVNVKVNVKVKAKMNMPRKRMLAAVVNAGRAAALLPRRGKVAGSKNYYIDPVVAVTTKATPPYHPHPTAATTITIMTIMKQRRKTTMKVTATAAAAMAVAMALVKQHRERAAEKGRRKSGNQRGKRTA